MKPTLNPPAADVSFIESRLDSTLRQLDSSPLRVEGLNGASRAWFLAHLRKATRRPIMVLTAGQNSGETLLGDLKYFFAYEKIRKAPEFFPAWELLPYEHLSPLTEVSGERLDILARLQEGESLFLVVPVEAAMQGVLPGEILRKQIFPVKKGDNLDREVLETCLADNGYTRVGLVEDRGQFSVRGDIIDFFHPGYVNPVRVELFGDEVESLRFFDPGSQVSVQEVAAIRILPVREVCLSPDDVEQGIQNILDYGRVHEVDRFQLNELVDRIRHLGGFSGIENLAPFFYSQRETLFDYLPADTLIVLDEEEPIRSKSIRYHDLVQTEYENAIERGDVAAAPRDFYLDPEEFSQRVSSRSCLIMNTLKLSDSEQPDVVPFTVKPIPTLPGRFESFAEQVCRWQEEGMEVILIAPTRGQVKRVHELLDEWGLSVGVDRGYISSGFEFPLMDTVFVAEHEIFGRSHKHRYRRKPKSQSFQRGFKDLKAGDFLVHIDYGIGKYLGTRELKTGVGEGEFLEIVYADDEKLYIPMDGLAYIQKYQGAGEASPPLSKLGSISWRRQKEKVKESIREMAEDLLKLYAIREISQGTAFSGNHVLKQEFSDSFEYEETEDQLKAIEEVCEDLEQVKPTDRLICGDVGYGKTEVAMRAAFQVVLDKKQVGVLVPTTILAQQHLNTFRERFRNYPVNIEMVSRFRTPRQQKQILENLKKGKLDIIIGTHRLLSKDVEFADLGLIIIDEEQRFGVRHKEQLKKLRATVDILTLTATPIPRTLHFSLMGIRDLSVIETPPSDRLAIKTFVRKFDDKIIREAILRELDRDGQIFFVHNKIQSIYSVAEMLQKVVPEVRVDVAHGQLPEKQLESVMRGFIDKEIDLLLCTSIIESGLDIPQANTIIINRADQFGLAQLYQLRGRVGRYKHQAYAYLLIPGAMAISSEARKRIQAVEEMSELGSGFQLAARDMEIRGTGNLLGHHQSGHISSVGFDLYCKLMEDTIKELKGEKLDQVIEPEMDLMIKGYIPRDYIPDLNQRLEIYRRIQLITDLPECGSMKKELGDRYGELPEPVEKLLALLEVKILCQKLHISKILLRGGEIRLTIQPSTPMRTSDITALLGEKMRFLSEYQIGIQTSRKGWRDELGTLKEYLYKLKRSHED